MTTPIAADGALERPEQVRLGVRVRGDDRAIGEDEPVLDDVVGGEPGAADQPADAATGGAAADADRAGSCSTSPTEAATTLRSRSRSRSGRQLAQDILESSVVVSVPVISLPGTTGYIPHQVAAGDTLTSIADRLGSAVERIVAANNLANPDVIQVGQLLRVPV